MSNITPYLSTYLLSGNCYFQGIRHPDIALYLRTKKEYYGEINCLNCHEITSQLLIRMMITEREVAEKIHTSALALLDDPGIRLEHDEICRLMLKAGAKKVILLK